MLRICTRKPDHNPMSQFCWGAKGRERFAKARRKGSFRVPYFFLNNPYIKKQPLGRNLRDIDNEDWECGWQIVRYFLRQCQKSFLGQLTTYNANMYNVTRSLCCPCVFSAAFFVLLQCVMSSHAWSIRMSLKAWSYSILKIPFSLGAQDSAGIPQFWISILAFDLLSWIGLKISPIMSSGFSTIPRCPFPLR